jgi:uncharacterized metal-binding protein YceD (DUF177 family)
LNKNDFIIQFGGLREGVHNFVFDINKEFFDLIDYSELQNSNLKINLELNKMSSMLVFKFVSNGTVELVCDRCLDKFNYDIDFDETIFVKFGNTYQEVDIDVIYLERGEYEIDILDLIYQFIMLNLPISKIHPEDEFGNTTCNEKMINKINEFNGIENELGQEEVVDSRWNELKKLKNGTSKKKDFSAEKGQEKNAL